MPAFTPIEDFTAFTNRLHHHEGFIYFGAPGEGGERGDYEIVTALPERRFILDATSPAAKNPSTVIDDLASALSPTLELSPDQLEELPFVPPFIGGLAGCLAYEAGCYLDDALTDLRSEHDGRLISAGLYSWAAVKERRSGRAALFWHPSCPADKRTLIEGVASDACGDRNPPDDFQRVRPFQLVPPFQLVHPFASEQTAEAYRAKVSTILDYLHAGDAYQVNLSQRFHARYEGSPWRAFQAMNANHEAGFAAYYDDGDSQILSLSPERFVLVDQAKVITAPIKGTRPRGKTPDEDDRLRNELANSAKDRAENLMIVDLLRNDLGKQCVNGSIQADAMFVVESHPNVHHLVSYISGRLRSDCSALGLLLSAFPGGSITGAPKRRAMEIIRELEPHRRGPYCGSLFYISHHGRMDSSIAIRTLQCKDGVIECWGGGGVVVDSDPQSEYEESCVKVRRLMEILEQHR